MFPPFLDKNADEVAQRLLGCELVRQFADGQIVRVRIVETESYDQYDAASHSYKGRTPRTDVMFGPSGHLYVYFTYGMHYCCNVVTGPNGVGSAVLIRAVEPVQGKELMEEFRKIDGVNISNGPAKLCQALQIDKKLNGHDLRTAPVKLVEMPTIPSKQIVSSTRIGISKATEELKRWYIRDNPYVSRVVSKGTHHATSR